jgi:multiple sugar transport system substrate-binding protein
MTNKPLSRRDFLRLTALAAGGAALAACGQKATQAPSGGGEMPTEAPSTGETVSLRMWSHQNTSFVAANDELVKKYMDAHPNVEIKYENFPYADFITTIQTSMAAKNEADVMEMFGSWVQSYAKGGTLAEVPEVLMSMSKAQDLFYAAPLDGYVWEGKLYGFPNEYNLEVGSVLANQRMFEEAGVKYPPEWKSWDELVADAKQMTKVENGVMTVSGFDYVTGDGLGFLFWEGVLERGADYFAEDKVHLVMNSPEAVETVQWLTDMAQKDKVVDPFTFNGDSNWVGDSFFQGLVAIGYIGPWIVPEGRKNYPDFPDPWEDVSSPFYGSQRKFAADAGWGKVISPNSKVSDTAWDIALFWTQDPANARYWNVNTGTVPALKSVAEDPTLLNDINWLGPSLKVLPYGQYVGDLQDRDYIWYNVIQTRVTECLQGVRSVEETCNMMNDEANAQIDAKLAGTS